MNNVNSSRNQAGPLGGLNLASENGPLTPSALSGDVNNYAPTGWGESVTWLRLDPGGAARAITGLSATAHGHLVLIQNCADADNEDITLTIESTASTAANRFVGANNASVVIRSCGTPGGGGAAFVIYDGIVNRWCVVAI